QINKSDLTCVTNVYVRGDISFQGTTDMNSAGRPKNLRIYSSGTEIEMGGNPTIHALIYAPHAACDLGGTPDIYGSVTCNTASSNGTNAFYHYDESLGDVHKYPGRFKVIAWKVVPLSADGLPRRPPQFASSSSVVWVSC